MLLFQYSSRHSSYTEPDPSRIRTFRFTDPPERDKVVEVVVDSGAILEYRCDRRSPRGRSGVIAVERSVRTSPA